MTGTSTLDSLLHWEGTKQLLNYQETGFQLEEAPSGSGILFMPGKYINLMISSITNRIERVNEQH